MSQSPHQPPLPCNGSPANVGILLFPEVEVLDFAGPFEVLSVAARIAHKVASLNTPPFQVFTVAQTKQSLIARHGLQVVPTFGFDTCPALDIVIVPGGIVDAPLASRATLDWIAHQAQNARLVASVCNGALILAQTGLLDNLSATTHWEHIAEMRQDFPRINVVESVPFVDQGHIVTSAGIAAGIEMSLHLVRRLVSQKLAEATARQMQYEWSAV